MSKVVLSLITARDIDKLTYQRSKNRQRLVKYLSFPED
jgi:hypothetical protein